MTETEIAAEPPVAALRYLTGRPVGRTTWFAGDLADLMPGRAAPFMVPSDGASPPPPEAWARLRRRGARFAVEAPEGRDLWLNGKPVERAALAPGDVLEFGEDGPLARLAIHHGGFPEPQSVGDLLGDAGAYVRASRQPSSRRAARAVGTLLRRLATETTLQFRLGLVAAVAAIALGLWWQGRQIAALQEDVDVDAARIAAVAASIAEAQQEALRPDDLEALRREMQARLSETEADLGSRLRAEAAVVRAAARSVVFIQGGFGFRDAASGRMLRHVLGPDGRPSTTPSGRPLLSLDGDGPPAQRVWTGTGFLTGSPMRIATNHHVAAPWQADPAALAVAPQGLEPVLLRLEAFLPGAPEPVPLTLAASDETSDLALLAPPEAAVADRTALPLAGREARIGERALAMGFPTGLRAMMARGGPEALSTMRARRPADEREVALLLASLGLIEPLVTAGIVAQKGRGAVVFDAATARGGSGGPLLSLEGEVLGVQTAILADFGGSNFAVPVDKLRALLDDASVRSDEEQE